MADFRMRTAKSLLLYRLQNKDTKKGDILIHYETAPVSAITCLWIAQVEGVIDPFFHYYSNTYIGDRIEIPHISLNELKTDGYFSNHSG